jgi:hypothetical protein
MSSIDGKLGSRIDRGGNTGTGRPTVKPNTIETTLLKNVDKLIHFLTNDLSVASRVNKLILDDFRDVNNITRLTAFYEPDFAKDPNLAIRGFMVQCVKELKFEELTERDLHNIKQYLTVIFRIVKKMDFNRKE